MYIGCRKTRLQNIVSWPKRRGLDSVSLLVLLFSFIPSSLLWPIINISRTFHENPFQTDKRQPRILGGDGKFVSLPRWWNRDAAWSRLFLSRASAHLYLRRSGGEGTEQAGKRLKASDGRCFALTSGDIWSQVSSRSWPALILYCCDLLP